MALRWTHRYLALMLGVCALTGGVLWVNYSCCYWPFTYNPFPELGHRRSVTLSRSVANGLTRLSNYVPDTHPDAAVLSALARNGSVARLEIAYQSLGTSRTDELSSASSTVRVLFSRSNRIDRVPQTFWTNTPYFVLLYTTNGLVHPPILYDRPRGIWRFGSYYFSLKGPTNFNMALDPTFGGMWEWPTASDSVFGF